MVNGKDVEAILTLLLAVIIIIGLTVTVTLSCERNRPPEKEIVPKSDFAKEIRYD